MVQTTPPRQRPDFHLSLTPHVGTPNKRHQESCGSTPFVTPHARSIGTKYSPIGSVSLQPATPYGGTVPFTPKPKRNQGFSNWKYVLYKCKYTVNGRSLVLIAILAALLWWWRAESATGQDLIQAGESNSGVISQLFEIAATNGLQFIPASDPNIHVKNLAPSMDKANMKQYVGRWTPTPNRLRIDGTFPGIYFDINIVNTTTLYLCLGNTAEPTSFESSTSFSPAFRAPAPANPNPGHISFHHSPLLDKPAFPVSLLVRVDQEEYVMLPNSSALVSVRADIDPVVQHQIRIIVPMTDADDSGVLQLEGLWLSKYGKLVRVSGSLLHDSDDYESVLSVENAKHNGPDRKGLGFISGAEPEKNLGQLEGKNDVDNELARRYRKKIIEVITDSTHSLGRQRRDQRTGGADGLLAGVMEWEFLLGEMFSVDHVAIGVDGMCLIQNCFGAVGSPSGMGDVFFRSGPPQSSYFEYPWMFHSYIPDVLILNLGSSDKLSFQNYETDYNMSAWDFSGLFEDAYVSLVRSIRQLAYPKHPAILYSERTGSQGYLPPSTPASIPIFVMRPLKGELEHATQSVVERLRDDGDQSIFWIDTSGWLADVDGESRNEDFYLDKNTTPATWRLTEQGNQRVAIFLHMHVCRYLASSEDQCSFLPSSVYKGKVFNPEETNFDRYLENDKERKLRMLFWGLGDEVDKGINADGDRLAASEQRIEDSVWMSGGDVLTQITL